MKFPILLLLVLLLPNPGSHSFTAASQASINNHQQEQTTVAPLTNKDVLELIKSGLSTDIIVAKIKASATNFDTSTAALHELKEAQVPDAIILAMVQAPAGAAEKKAAEVARPGEPKARVYVYRHKNFGTRNMQPSVYADGVEVARMDDGRYFIITLDPGKHTIEVNKGHSGAEIDMKAGEDYYFKVEIVTGFWKGRGSIDYVQREQGVLEVKKMKPLEAKWIKDKSKVTVETETAKAQ